MKFDIFFSICQTEVDGYKPSEKTMFQNFFDQVTLADRLGFGTAWIAESHLSTEVQKVNKKPVVPHFKGEIGLNTDIFQIAHKVFSCTENINVGSAIHNIICNGGPLAHAEMTKTFLSLHGLDRQEKRKLFLGFAAGRFPFSNAPYHFKPRNELEEIAWPVLKSLGFKQATEIFLRALKNETISSESITPIQLAENQFKNKEDWEKIENIAKKISYLTCADGKITVPPFWEFEKVGVIPYEAPLDLLQLVIGSHDPDTQVFANEFFPCWVFNLSITPSKTIEHTHRLMAENFHEDGGSWQRDYMPRTALVFVNGDNKLSKEEQTAKAKAAAHSALENYWKALEGTLSPEKLENAVNNSIYGNPERVTQMLKERYHPKDRLMLWMDFNSHDNQAIKDSMRVFAEEVMPHLSDEALS